VSHNVRGFDDSIPTDYGMTRSADGVAYRRLRIDRRETMDLGIRFDYGSVVPWVRRSEDGIRATPTHENAATDGSGGRVRIGNAAHRQHQLDVYGEKEHSFSAHSGLSTILRSKADTASLRNSLVLVLRDYNSASPQPRHAGRGRLSIETPIG
jgi:hypothetical protein